MGFRNRKSAGEKLATLLAPLAAQPIVVVGIPPGGVLVAAEVARALRAPLSFVLARRITPPSGAGAIGGVAEQGVLFIDAQRMRAAGISRLDLESAAQRATRQLARQLAVYRAAHPIADVAGRTVLLIDDAIVTGNTARAAARALRDLRPRRIILAAPVIAELASAALQEDVDAIVCASEPPGDHLLPSDWYEDGFPDVADAQVLDLLRGGAPARLSTEA